MINDDFALLYKDQESNRNINAAELEAYSDRYSMTKNDMYDNDVKGDYLHAQQLEEAKSLKASSNFDANTQQLSLDYPEGISEKIFERKNSRGDVIEVTIIRIIVRNNKGDEYRKVKSKWGVSYFKNGGATSEYVWDTETN